MEFSRSNDLLSIFSESMKLLPKNGKLMAFIALFSAVLYACFVFLFSYSVESISLDMVAATQKSFMPDSSSFDPDSFNSTAPSSGFDLVQITRLVHQIRQDTAFIFAVEVAFILAESINSFFSAISTILLSALSYNSKISSLKELLSTICRSWTRPLITGLYVSALSIGYFSTIAIFAAPLWIYPDLPTFWLGILIGAPSFLFYLYLLVPWILSVVVSAVEENCIGMEALGKAAALVKGKRLQGFLINVLFGLVALIISQFYRIKIRGNGLEMMFLMVVMIASCLMRFLLLVAYTVFYFQCKMQHGEEIELHGSVQYTKLSSTAVLANDMP